MTLVSVPENLDRGAFGIERPGTYHLQVMEFDEYPQKKNGEAIAGWRFKCGVLAGTDPSQVGNDVDITLRHPRASNNDGGEFLARVQSRFLLSICLITEGQKGTDVEVDLEQSVNRQFFAKFSYQPYTDKNGNKIDKHDIDGTNIFHVDDGLVSGMPKSESMLRLIPQDLRMISGKDGPAGSIAKTASPATNPTQGEYSEPVKSRSGKVDYDSL